MDKAPKYNSPEEDSKNHLIKPVPKAPAKPPKWKFDKSSLSKMQKEELFSEEELAHMQAVMESNPEGNAIAGRDPNARQGDSDKSTVGGITNESKKKK
jgi:hypothetical protein